MTLSEVGLGQETGEANVQRRQRDLSKALSEGGAGPHAHFTEYLTAGGTVRPHFHPVSQFQVVVGGSGKIGKHPLAPITVYYTDAYTPYGPIIVGPEGVNRFVLRPYAKEGTYYMPESRNKMERKAGRTLVFQVDPNPSPHLSALPVFERLAEVPENGTAAFRLQLEPGARFTGPDPAQGGGQWYIVANGSFLRGTTEYPPLSLLFVSSGEPPLETAAGPTGLDVLILQHPREDGSGS